MILRHPKILQVIVSLSSLGGTQCKIDSLTPEVGLYAGLQDIMHHIPQPNVISVSLTIQLVQQLHTANNKFR